MLKAIVYLKSGIDIELKDTGTWDTDGGFVYINSSKGNTIFAAPGENVLYIRFVECEEESK